MVRAFVCLFAFALPCLAFAQKVDAKPAQAIIQASRQEGTYNRPVDVFFSCSDPLATLRFRFLPESSDWFYADRVLVLDAALREVRSYSVVVEARKSGVTVGSKSFSWTIDRKPPAAPVPSVAEGVVRLPFSLTFSAEENAKVFWTVFGGGFDSTRFQAAPSISVRSIDGLSEEISVCAYAVDAYGNPGLPVCYRYVLAKPEAVFSSRASKDTQGGAAVPAPVLPLALKAVPVETDSGFIVDLGELDRENIPVMAVSDTKTAPAPDAFAEVIRVKDSAAYQIPAPYGYLRPLYAFWGLRAKNGTLSFSSVPFELVRRKIEITQAVPVSPDPVFDVMPDGGTVFSFPDFQIPVEYRLGQDSWTRYGSPVSLGSFEGKSVDVAWRAAPADGSKGTEAKRTVTVPKTVRAAGLEGIPETGSANVPLKIGPEGQAVVRYEVSDNGTFPPEVTARSPILETGTVFDSGPGMTVSFLMRYRTFQDASETAFRSGERLAAFSVDREAPLPPVLSPDSAVAGFSSQDSTVAFRGSDGGMTYAIEDSRGGKSAEIPYTGPILLKAPESGRITFTIRARSTDPAGNVSPWSSPVTISLDKSSVYVAQSGSDTYPGTPSKPLRSLDAAIAACAASGKKVVYLSGSALISRPVTFSRDISVYGGYESDFIAMDRVPSTIAIAEGLAGTPVTVAKGVSVSLESVAFARSDDSRFPLLSVFGGLVLRRSAFALSSKGNSLWIESSGGSIECSDTGFSISSGVSQTLFGLTGASFKLADSTIAVSDGVMFSSLFRLDSCESTVSNCRISSASGGGTQVCQTVNGSLAFRRNLVTGRGAGAFFRFLSAQGTRVDISNSIFDVDAKGEFVVVESNGGKTAFTHNTLLAGKMVTGGSVLSLDQGSFEFVNNLLVSSGTAFHAAKGKRVDGSCLTNVQYGLASLSPDAPLAALLGPGFIRKGDTVPYVKDGKGMPALYRGSPCVDSGSRSGDDGLDFAGTARNDGKPDIGALELRAQ